MTEKGPAVVSRVYVSQTEVWPVSKPEAIDKPKLDRREAFQAAASDLNATFVQGKRSSGDQIHLEHGPWKVVLDTYVVSNGQTTVTYTRAQALYVARDNFILRVTRRNIFTRIAELFEDLGFYGLLVGDQELVRKYKIKSSNDPRGRSFMMDRRLHELISLYDGLNRRRSGLSTTSGSAGAAALRLASPVPGALPFSSILSRSPNMFVFSAFALL